MMPDPITCWNAIESRDRSYEGQFVVAVKTTRIYCRPGCPARTPLQKNVEFYAVPAAAELAGFRACKRCKPQEVDPCDEHAMRVEALCRHIQSHLDGDLSLEALGDTIHLSPTYVQRTFQAVMGISPHQYVEAQRMQCFRDQVKRGERITDAIYAAGFQSSSRLYERTEQLGMTPVEYQRGGAGLQIHYTVTESVMGWLLVGATERGICSITLGETESEAFMRFKNEFPRATLQRNDEALKPAVSQVIAYFKGWQPHFELPLDLRVTAFQKRVLEELCRIGYGQTRTYSEIAAAIGSPKSARAVGRACATNPVPFVVPCHRVVGQDGSLTGYAYGVDLKRTLLEMEKNPAVEAVKQEA
jgi:AraC family transcriptional regulator of adaptative response/methylated-DNA-[protein]-cysteine methyltransferase